MKLFDVIEDKGLNYFLSNTEVILKQLDVSLDPGVQAQLGDAYLDMKDHTSWEMVMKWGVEKMPGDPMSFVIYADGLVKLNRKPEAIKVFEEAISLAIKHKQQGPLEYAESRLKSLGN